MQVDLNADVGEGAASDLALLDVVSSANIACGMHAGGPVPMVECVRACVARGVALGAHPSFGDGGGFGRVEQPWDAAGIHAALLYQLGALAAIAQAQGARLDHVKPHGALYNQSARDIALADAVVAAVSDFDASLAVYALAGGRLADAARAGGLACFEEGFADRAYRPDGSLVPRTDAHAVLTDADDIAARAVAMVVEGRVRAIDGAWIAIHPQTICVHGDHPQAHLTAQRLRAALEHAGVDVKGARR